MIGSIFVKKILNSIQAKLFLIVASIVVITILFLVIINGVIFEAYYYYHIKNHLISSFENGYIQELRYTRGRICTKF